MGQHVMKHVLMKHLKTPRGSGPYLELMVLLLEVLVFVRVAVGELVDLDPVLLDLLSDLRGGHNV